MPLHDEILVRKPVIMAGGALFNYISPFDVTESSVAPGSFAVHGGVDRRGVAYYPKDFASSFGTEIVTLSRGDQFVLSGPDFPYQFSAEANLPTPATQIPTTYHVIDGIFWFMGGLTSPVVYAKADGLSYGTGVWVDRSADSGMASGRTYFMRKAAAAGFLYYIVKDDGGSPDYNVMRGAVATAPNVAFTNVTTTPVTPTGNEVVAYEVSPDGLVQIFALDDGRTFRSTNGGASFGSITPGINPIDISYSSVFNRWTVMSTGGVRYSDNNGTSWSTPTRIETNPKNAGQFQSFATNYHLERLDAEGRYLMLTSSYAPIRLYLSEDGGKSWVFFQQMMPPGYNVSQAPRIGNTSTATLALVRTRTSLLIYQGSTPNQSDPPFNWNFDNGVFSSGPLDFPF